MNPAERLFKATQASIRNILVIGDTMTDIWIRGRVEGCQERCQKMVEIDRYTVPGGAGNAARSLQQWNVCVKLFGLNHLDRPVKCRFVDEYDNILFRWDQDVKTAGGFDHNEAIYNIKYADGVLLSDYDKGFLTPEFIKEVISLCNAKEIPCVVDAKRHPELYKGAIIKANEEWFRNYNNADVVTFGGYRPIVCYENDTRRVVTRVMPPVPCINHVGAGDCFAAHLTLALTYKFTLEEAVAIAYSAGRVYVQHRFNSPPNIPDIIKDMD